MQSNKIAIAIVRLRQNNSRDMKTCRYLQKCGPLKCKWKCKQAMMGMMSFPAAVALPTPSSPFWSEEFSHGQARTPCALFSGANLVWEWGLLLLHCGFRASNVGRNLEHWDVQSGAPAGRSRALDRIGWKFGDGLLSLMIVIHLGSHVIFLFVAYRTNKVNGPYLVWIDLIIHEYHSVALWMILNHQNNGDMLGDCWII